MTLSAVFIQHTKKIFQITVLALLSTCATVQAKSSGEKLYQQCTACHGLQGEGVEALNAPTIAGQDAQYIKRQLNSFSAELRGKSTQAKTMVAVAKNLTKADIDEVASYIQAMPIAEQPSKSDITGNLKNGSRYYQAKCGACHGGQAQGNKGFNAPRLAQQSSQYLRQQMQDFVSGKRGYDQQDKFGRQMAMMAKTTKDQELEDILFYISKQQVNSKAK